MKINTNVLSIPPHISTSWQNITALHMKNSTLYVNLLDGETIEIPNLDAATLTLVFDTHAAFVEEEQKLLQFPERISHPLNHLAPATHEQKTDPFRVSIGAMDELGTALTHNPAQANGPNIPPEILHKIVAITKIIAPEEGLVLPKPEPHCNCVHCQIAKAVHQEPSSIVIEAGSKPATEKEEVITDADLQFQQWEISQNGNHLYTVINRLDTKERYSVYLGNPIGCTCGKANCEHIVAVLKS